MKKESLILFVDMVREESKSLEMSISVFSSEKQRIPVETGEG